MDEFNNNNLMGVVYLFSGACGVYPGATTRPEEREHVTALKNGRHSNENFQDAVNRCGLLNFVYLPRELVPFDKLAEEEQKLYDKVKKSGFPLLSKRRPASKPHPVGYKLSEKTRRKQARAKKGNKNAAKQFVFLAPNGTRVETCCLSDLCKRYDLDISAMSRLAHDKRKSHRGWCKA
jgi:hypothetical protein